MKVWIIIVGLSTSLMAGGNVWAAPFSSLYVFGDSLSDAGSSPSSVMSLYIALGGNCDLSHPCGSIGPYSEGRFSNGPVAPERLASSLFPAGVTDANFHSYAVAGATSGLGNYGDGGTAVSQGTLLPGISLPGISLPGISLPGMRQEVDYYKIISGGVADPNALYFVWGGANDYLTNDSPTGAAQNIAGYVSELASAGARHFLVPNLPDLGLTPYARDNGVVFMSDAQTYSLNFNKELETQLGVVNSGFPAADIFQFDIYTFLNGVIQNPGSYGLTHVTDSCLFVLIPCGSPFSSDSVSPDKHLFWDSFHPTTQADAIIASAFASAVPEPEIIAMLIAGLCVLCIAANRRRTLEQASIRTASLVPQ